MSRVTPDYFQYTQDRIAHYGGLGKFSGPEDEGLAHSADLKMAAVVLKEKLPDIQVFAYLVHKEQRPQETFVFQQVAV